MYPASYLSTSNPRIGGTYGFVTKQGDMLLPPILNGHHMFRSPGYEKFFRIINNRMLVDYGANRYFYIDTQGKKVLPKDSTYYHIAYSFKNRCNCAKVSEKTNENKTIDYLIDTYGNKLYSKYDDYYFGNIGVHGGSDISYPLPSKYVFLSSTSKNRFIILNSNKEEIFSHDIYDDDYGYSFYKYYDQKFMHNERIDFGLIIEERNKIDTNNKGRYKKFLSTEIRVLSYHGKVLSTWGKIEMYDNLLFEKDHIKNLTTDEIVVKYKPKTHLIKKNDKSSSYWDENDIKSKRKYFKGFKPSFDEQDLIKAFGIAYSEKAKLIRTFEHLEESFFRMDKPVVKGDYLASIQNRYSMGKTDEDRSCKYSHIYSKRDGTITIFRIF